MSGYAIVTIIMNMFGLAAIGYNTYKLSRVEKRLETVLFGRVK